MVQRDGVVIGPKGKPLKPELDKDGYQRFTIRKRHYSGHRLVYEAFVGPIPKGMVCCHSDGNPRNNRVDNLRVDTQRANIADKKAHGTHQVGEKHPCCIYPETIAAQVRSFLEQHKGVWGAKAQAALLFGVPYHFVFDVERGRRSA